MSGRSAAGDAPRNLRTVPVPRFRPRNDCKAPAPALECAAAHVGSRPRQDVRSVPIPQEGHMAGGNPFRKLENFLDSTAGLWVTTLAGVGVIVGIVVHFFSS